MQLLRMIGRLCGYLSTLGFGIYFVVKGQITNALLCGIILSLIDIEAALDRSESNSGVEQ